MSPCEHWDTSRRRCLVGHQFPTDCRPACLTYKPVAGISPCMAHLWHQLTRSTDT
jgi:hypothetical protein